jgi:hypothetical protein
MPVTMEATDVLVARSDIALGQTVTPDDSVAVLAIIHGKLEFHPQD